MSIDQLREQLRRFAPYFGASLVAAALMFCLGSLHAYAHGLNHFSREFDLDSGPQASLVFDRDNRLIFSFASEERTDIALDQLSPAVVPAVLATEDRYFYDHIGLDAVRMLGAAWADMRARGLRQGGSTITQQVVRSLALTRKRSFARKWREVLLAIRIDRRFTKDEILHAYLNRIYLGDGYYGIQAAARGYFGKSASELSNAEAALLAGLIKCPSACSPRANPTKAWERRETALRAMLDVGAISADQYRAASAEDVRIEPKRDNRCADEHDAEPCGLYFFETVRRQLVAQFGDRLLTGGLRIYTTIDMDLQKAAEDAIAGRLEELDPDKKANGKAQRLEGSLVSLDPRTGEVLALVGGRSFHRSSFNRAMQARRQPGSAFKPLLFAAAIENGYSPSSVVTGLDTPIATPSGDWLPSGEHEAEAYTLRRALTVSSNRAAVRLMQLVGIGTTQNYARRLGISSPLPAVPSLAIGTAEVSLIDLTSAYGAFAAEGIVAPHTLIRHVDDPSGETLWQNEHRAYRAVRPGTAYLMSSMLADVMNRGTGTRTRSEGFKLPAAGKTGTTDDYADAWFIGYTPRLTTGVWFGYDRRAPIMRRGFAATVAAPAWARFMLKATAADKPDWYKAPADIERVAICRESGLRATDACSLSLSEDGESHVFEDYFLRGTAPYEYCSIHGGGQSKVESQQSRVESPSRESRVESLQSRLLNP